MKPNFVIVDTKKQEFEALKMFGKIEEAKQAYKIKSAALTFGGLLVHGLLYATIVVLSSKKV